MSDLSIVKVRLSADTEEELRAFTEILKNAPGVLKADALSVKANYRDEGYRGYTTILIQRQGNETSG